MTLSSNRPNWYPLIDYLLIDSSKIIAQNLQLLAINKYAISNNLAFSDIVRKNALDGNEEYTSLMMWIHYSTVFL